MCRELGRLSNGYKDIIGTKTICFISKDMVPKSAKLTHMRIVCTSKPHKSDPERIRLCAGGDQLIYDSPLRTPTTDITTVKLHANSTTSTKGARYMTGDINNFYLSTSMRFFEYARNHRKTPHKSSST